MHLHPALLFMSTVLEELPIAEEILLIIFNSLKYFYLNYFASDIMAINWYNSITGEVRDPEPQLTEYIHRRRTWRQYIHGNNIIIIIINFTIIIINSIINTILNSPPPLAGISLASLAGILFTVNSFVINQTQVDVELIN